MLHSLTTMRLPHKFSKHMYKFMNIPELDSEQTPEISYRRGIGSKRAYFSTGSVLIGINDRRCSVASTRATSFYEGSAYTGGTLKQPLAAHLFTQLRNKYELHLSISEVIIKALVTTDALKLTNFRRDK